MWEISDIMAFEDLRGESLYAALMALKPADLAEGEWAARAGMSRGYFTDLKKKDIRPRIDTLANILGAIGASVGNLNSDPPPRAVEVLPAPKPFSLGELPRDVPVMGTATGAMLRIGADGRTTDIEKTLVEKEPFGHVRRPPSLSRNLKVYALYVAGHSMEPRYRHGDLVYVDTRREASIGDDVVVQLIEEARDDADPAEIQSVLIKTLTRRTSTELELEQFNPGIVFRVKRRTVAMIHRVIPLAELMS